MDKTQTTPKTGIEKARETAQKIKGGVPSEAEIKERTDQAIPTIEAKKEEPKAEEPVAVTPKVETPEPKEDKIEKIENLTPATIDKSGQLVFTDKHLALIKNNIAKDATKEEFELFIMMARRTRLDPIMRQLHFIKYGSNVSYVTSIDGYRIIAHRTNDFAGVDEPNFEYEGKLLTHCSITVYKLVQGVRCGFSAKVKFSEYNTGKQNWAKMPETMIAKVAEAHALRKAFPNDLSGVYTQDEMDQAEHGRAPVAKPEPLMTKVQVEKIVELLDRKGKTKEQLQAFIKKAFNKVSKEVTVKEANQIIAQLAKFPDLQPDPALHEEATPEIANEVFGQSESASEDLNLDEIDAGIQKMQEERERGANI